MLTAKDKQFIQEIINSSNDALKKEMKNDIANFQDVIIGRLDKIDQELAVTNGYGDKLKNHEERITKLERNQPVPA